MIGRVLASVALALTLVACGGEDSGGAAPPPPTGGGTPTPSPSPSPSSTPSPTPTPTYSTIAQLTGNQRFETSCAYRSFQFGSSPSFRPDQEMPFGSRGALSFDAAATSWTYNEGNPLTFEPPVAVTFGPSDLLAGSAISMARYGRTQAGTQFDLELQGRRQNNFNTDYVRTFSLTDIRPDNSKTERTCVYGVPTLASDTLPATLTPYASLNVTGVAFIRTNSGNIIGPYSLQDSTGTFAVNGQTGTISLTVQLVGREILANGRLTDTTTTLPRIVSTRSVIADARDPAIKTFTGEYSIDGNSFLPSNISGAFFGPKGQEAGLSFYTLSGGLGLQDQIVLAGIMVAQR